MRERAVPHRAFRRKGPSFDPRKGAVVRRHEARAAAHLDVEVAKRHAAFDRHRAHRRARIFHDVTARAGDAQLGDDAQRHVLGGHVRGELALQANQHGLRPPQRHHLRRQDVRELARSAAEGERAEASHRAGVAVGDRVGRARQHHAQFRRDHVRNTLLRVVDVEKPDAVAPAAVAHRLEKGRA